MNADSYSPEQALRMLQVDNRRTDVGRAVTKALADVNPRLADLATYGGHLLPGETREQLIADVARILRPLSWARPEIVVAAIMKPFGGYREGKRCGDRWVGIWTLNFVESDDARELAQSITDAKEQRERATVYSVRAALDRQVASVIEHRKELLRREALQHWQRLLDEVQAAWDACSPEVRS